MIAISLKVRFILPVRIYREEHLAETVRASLEVERRKMEFDIQTFNYNEEFDPGSG